MSLYMMVTLDSTSYLPQPLKEDDSHKQQSIKMKHYRILQSIGKKKFGLTPHMQLGLVKSKYAWYIWETNTGICPTGTTKEHILH